MTTEERQELFKALALAIKGEYEQIEKKVVRECEDCKGACYICESPFPKHTCAESVTCPFGDDGNPPFDEHDSDSCLGYHDCPTCTPLREELLAKVQELEWHEVCDIKYEDGKFNKEWINAICTCGESIGIFDSSIWLIDDEILTSKAVDRFHTPPRFTIDQVEGYISIVAELKALGLWEEFVKWHENACNEFNIYDRNDSMAFFDMSRFVYAEILTSTPLLAQAVISFLGRE